MKSAQGDDARGEHGLPSRREDPLGVKPFATTALCLGTGAGFRDVMRSAKWTW